MEILRAYERRLLIGATFALGWWLWPDGFLFGALAALTPKAVFLAACSMGVLAIASLMAIFAAAEPVAALIESARSGLPVHETNSGTNQWKKP